ncbi:MAG: DSD1 family PLP-dependent enzyme [Rhodospirillaceae bacterium]|jgi:3-hydroxy-D-aspartate aldolase|nr:DSD1 family PLP-dependent enzyme [Rhodospirillaceae bacterium]
MSMNPPAEPGDELWQVDTPALIVDLDAFERNLDLMADMVTQAGVKLRPHAKMHKSPWVALQQIERGAIGACCQKVSEAEVMVAGGVADVLVSNQVVGAPKLAKLAKLNQQASVRVCIDHIDAVSEISAAAEAERVVIDTLVEIDVGAGRCGVQPGQAALELARAIAADPHLSFGGLQAYHGSAQHRRTPQERKEAIDSAIAGTTETVNLLAENGLECAIVGGAGTGTFELEAASGVYNELQCGSYAFMDADYAKNKGADGGPFDTFEHALFVRAAVMSRPSERSAVVDAGHKACAIDSGLPVPWAMAGAEMTGMSDEHGVIDITTVNEKPERGDAVLLIPGHCDPTVNLHDWYVGVRGLHTPQARVEHVWPVAARGALF